MRYLLLLLNFVFLFSCTSQKGEKPITVTKDKTQLQMAIEDYNSVISGKPPIHAIIDEKHPLPADGGTTFYQGSGYKLEIRKRLTEENNIGGFIYGPIIVFDRTNDSGSNKDMSSLKFYNESDLKKLLNE